MSNRSTSAKQNFAACTYTKRHRSQPSWCRRCYRFPEFKPFSNQKKHLIFSDSYVCGKEGHAINWQHRKTLFPANYRLQLLRNRKWKGFVFHVSSFSPLALPWFIGSQNEVVGGKDRKKLENMQHFPIKDFFPPKTFFYILRICGGRPKAVNQGEFAKIGIENLKSRFVSQTFLFFMAMYVLFPSYWQQATTRNSP